MNNKIEIKSLSQLKTEYGCKVCFGITIRGKSYDLEYEIYSDEITSVPERADAVVITFLIYAIRHNLDITSNYPISEKLYYNIQKNIIPQIVACNPSKASHIKVTAPLTKETYSGTWNGTGVSLGVDSLTTIHEYTDDCILEDYRLTHLVHLRTGSQWTGEYNPDMEKIMFDAEHAKVKKYCEAYNHKLITIQTNLYEIAAKEFGGKFAATHIVRNLGTLMLIQNYFSKYYYASAYNLDNFKMNIDMAMGYYEKWLIPLLSSENLDFYSANSAMNRIEKTKYISKFSDSYDCLHVCWGDEGNCGKCRKCIRTLVTLDVLGILDKYKNSFDTDDYHKNRKKVLNKLMAMKQSDEHYTEIYEYMKANKIKTPNSFAVLWTKLFICIDTLNKYGIASFRESKTFPKKKS